MAKDKYSLESWLHTAAHFILVFYVLYLFSVLPVFSAIIILELWILQFLVIKHCFLTKFAHYRGIMLGMSFWEYVPYIMGVKEYRKTGKIIDVALKIIIITIILARVISLIVVS